MINIAQLFKKRTKWLQGRHSLLFKMPTGLIKKSKFADNVKKEASNTVPVEIFESLKLTKPNITDIDVLNIYDDVTKLGDIESYLKLYYRPFTCFVRSGCEYKLLDLKTFLANACYDPEKHSALFVRRTNPICSLKIYENGNIFCQGYSYKSVAMGIHSFISTIEHLGYSPIFHDPEFNAINATFRMPFPINLKTLYAEYYAVCSYDTANKPYLTYTIDSRCIKLIIFSMGHVYVLLASKPLYTRNAITFILPILYRHRMVPVSNPPELSSGDINSQLLWENELQKAYQGNLKYGI